jgi:quinol monooxygenase YgiN
MAAFNVVRFRVKPGGEQRFIDAHRTARPAFKGFIAGSLIRTGDQTFCMIGEWRNQQALAAARPAMIAILDSFRDTLEDLGGGLGVTDPVSGEVVARIAVPRPAKKRPAKRTARRAPARRAARKRKR